MRLHGARSGRVKLQLYHDRDAATRKRLRIESEEKDAAGYYWKDDKEIVAIEASNLGDPMALVGTIAHELAQCRLLGEKRITSEAVDHESLTDLTTVFFGMGIFNANSSFRFSQWTRGNSYGWGASKFGIS